MPTTEMSAAEKRAATMAVLRRLGFAPLRPAPVLGSKTGLRLGAGSGEGRGGVGWGGGDEDGVGCEVPARRMNGLVHLTAAPGHVRTSDPADSAHLLRMSGGGKDGGMLMPAGMAGPAAKRREYPPSQVNLAGLAVDSQFDELHERQRSLDRVAGGVAGISFARGGGATVGAAVASVLRRAGDEGARRIADGNRRVWDGE